MRIIRTTMLDHTTEPAFNDTLRVHFQKHSFTRNLLGCFGTKDES